MKMARWWLISVLVLCVVVLAACGDDDDNGGDDDDDNNARPTVTATLATPENNAINWSAGGITVTASNFHIIANGQLFLAPADAVTITAETPDDAHSTLQATWTENDVTMQVQYVCTRTDNTWSCAVRMTDGTANAAWVDFGGTVDGTVGSSYTVLFFGRGLNGNDLNMNNVDIRAFDPVE